MMRVRGTWHLNVRVRALRSRALCAVAMLLGIALLEGCATDTQAPIEQKAPLGGSTGETASPVGAVRSVPLPDRTPATLPANHVVVAGETLHAIAYRYDLDYRDLIRWNQITNPDLIRVGQVLRLQAPPPPQVATSQRPPPPPASPQWEALPPVDAAESGPRNNAESPARAGATSDERGGGPTAAARGTDRPVTAAGAHDKSAGEVTTAATAGAATISPTVPREHPDATAAGQATTPSPPAAAPREPTTRTPDAAQLANAAAATDAAPAVAANAGGLRWAWPAQGKVTPTESSSGAKGIDIRGVRGQPVLASAAGTVVYSGSGLRGLGELIIIKHNDTFLSAYAHNETRLVQEGSRVNAGDKIASMGNTDAADYMLHFEIRRNGKPVDPLQYLPSR